MERDDFERLVIYNFAKVRDDLRSLRDDLNQLVYALNEDVEEPPPTSKHRFAVLPGGLSKSMRKMGSSVQRNPAAPIAGAAILGLGALLFFAPTRPPSTAHPTVTHTHVVTRTPTPSLSPTRTPSSTPSLLSVAYEDEDVAVEPRETPVPSRSQPRTRTPRPRPSSRPTTRSPTVTVAPTTPRAPTPRCLLEARALRISVKVACSD